MKITNAFLVLVAVLTLGSGCANSAINQRLDEKLAQEKTPPRHENLQAEAKELISHVPGLTADQRAKLTSLRRQTHAEIDKINDESYRLRSLLLRDVITTHYDADEVQVIKDRLKSLEGKKLDVFFDSVSQADAILEHKAADEQMAFVHSFYEPHHAMGGNEESAK